MRGRPLNTPALGRAPGCVLVSVTIVATAVHLYRHGTPRALTILPAASRAAPLAAALARCQALGMAADSDTARQAAWAENRRRFFNDSPGPEGR